MAKMRCPRCGSDDVRRYYDELKCDRCDESPSVRDVTVVVIR